jgi:hydroxymethylbilane synthase
MGQVGRAGQVGPGEPLDIHSGQSEIRNRKSEIRIGTRASKLALTQTQWVADALMAAHPGLACEIVHITTAGDRQRAQPLPAIGGKGLFTKEIEEALLRGEIDLAVHSFKDLPTRLPDGLVVAAVPERAPANDALIIADSRLQISDWRSKNGGQESRVFAVPSGARIGTSSPRRAAQLRHVRPDLRPEPIRGNLDTRLRKLAEGRYDAILVALAGLIRLGLADRATEILPFDVVLPAPGQGALAIEIRAGDAFVADLVASVNDASAAVAVQAERALLEALGGGCSLPLGAYAELAGDTLRLRAILLSPDGSAARRADRTGPASDPAALAEAAAADLRRA